MNDSAASHTLVRESSARQLIEQSRVRLIYVMFVFALFFGAIGAKLIEIALFSGKAAPEAAQPIDASQQGALNDVNAALTLTRGDIVDRNNVLLATSLNTLSLFANPKVMIDTDDAARKLAQAFPDLRVADLRKKLKPTSNFAWIKRNLTPREQHLVNTLGIPGLYFQPEQKRVYPYGNLFSHALGYAGIDNTGLSGIEKYFDTRLRNTGYYREPLQLSLDARLQAILRTEMQKGVDEFHAIGATGIIMDMGSGELLALSNLPDFDPNEPGRASQETRFDRASLGDYEMGSTFKTFSTAMALDYGIVSMSDGFDISNPIKVAGFTINDAEKRNGWYSIPEIFAYSSNIGTVKMMMEVGIKKQKAFLQKLGMMEPVKIELPERSSPLYPKDWKEINLMTIAYGHGMSVSPLHLVHGIASVVYDGNSVPMTLVKGGNAHAERTRVVSEDTARKMRRLMRMVVQYGTASKANVAGYRVGGKTGTAEKITGHGYSKNNKLVLFASIYPVDDPKYLVLVMVDEPKGNKQTSGFATGGWIAAPIVANVIKQMGTLYGIRPVYDAIPENPADRGWVQKASMRFADKEEE